MARRPNASVPRAARRSARPRIGGCTGAPLPDRIQNIITATTFLELKLTATRLGLHYNLHATLVKARADASLQSRQPLNGLDR